MINLLPPSLKEARRYGRRNVKLLGYIVAIALTGVSSVGVFMVNSVLVNNDEHHLKIEMAERQTEITSLENNQKNIDKIAAQLKTVDKIYSSEVRFSEILPKIGALLPNGMVLNTLSLGGGKTSPLQLDVDMNNQELAAVFQQNLVHSDLFDAADISSITTKGGTTQSTSKVYGYGATLTARFKSPTSKTGSNP